MEDLAGKTLGRYQIVARIGRGGMAEVYKAYHQAMNRYVGIKVLHAHLVEDDSFIGRFEREARSIGQLRHPNIVQAIDFDSQHSMYYMVMEFIDGPTLKAEMSARQKENKPFTMEEVARIYLALGNALDYAHRRDMIHRDIKPANVMINQEGNIILTDFGIARIIGATTQFTQTGTMTGTPAYMSPEQGRGAKVDGRSDVYSLGVMLYEIVTGSVPFEAETPIGVVMKHVTEPLPPPRQVNAAIPTAVEEVIFKALQKNPDDRYQTPGALAQGIRQAVGLPLGDSLQNHPLAIVAPPLKFEEARPITGSIVKEQRVRTGSLRKDSATVVTDTPQPTQAPFQQPADKPQSMMMTVAIAITALTIMLVGGGLLGYAFFVVMDTGETNDAAVSATNTPIVIGAITNTPSPDATTDNTVAVAAEDEDTPTPEPTVDTAATSTTEAISAGATATAAQMFSDITVATAVAATNEAVQGATTTAQEVIAATSTGEAIAEATAQAEIEAVAAEATADAAATATTAAASTATAIALLPTNTPLPTPTPTLPPLPTDTPTPERPALSGKLAFPVDNGAGRYDLYIVSMPDGNVLARVDGVRQPDFRRDGQKLVVNAQGGGFGENLYEISANGNIDRPVSSSPTDAFPSYNNPYADRIVYSNPQLAIGTDGNYHSYIFVQCSLLPPSQEPEQTCNDIARFGILVPAGQIGEIQGTHPVWAENDHIFYQGCNTWAGGGSCGIFTVASWGNKRNSNGETPRKILDGTSAAPTDSVGNLLAYHANVGGNWEAFVVGLNGAAPINISNSGATDGLPTISPDGQWVAFASDRSGVWAVYVVPTIGGEPTPLFDFPKANPWAAGGGREWQNERMSWGP